MQEMYTTACLQADHRGTCDPLELQEDLTDTTAQGLQLPLLLVDYWFSVVNFYACRQTLH